MNAQLSAHGLQAEIVESLPDDPRFASSNLTRGELECYRKHMEVYRRFLATGREFALVLEDDAILPQRFGQVLGIHIPSTGFDLFFISDDYFDKPHEVISQYIIKTNSSKTTCAYLVGRHAAEVMLKYALAADIPIDHKMNDIIAAHSLHTYWHSGLVRHGSVRDVFPSAIKHTEVLPE